MCRLAAMALLAAFPNMPQMPHESSSPAAAPNRLPPVLAASPNTTATVDAIPASIARAAWVTRVPTVAPPMLMLHAMRGLMPSSSPRAR
jgi:hypothetical protein